MKWNYYKVDPRKCVHHPVYYPKAYEYAKKMEAGVIFPPVKMHVDKNGRFIIQNGAHRTVAALLSNRPLLVKTKHTFENTERIMP